EQDGAEGADRRGFGRAEDAGIDAADRHDEQQQELPRLLERADALAQRKAFALRRIVRLDVYDRQRDRHVQSREHDAREQARGQEFWRRQLGDRRVDGQDDRRRDEDVGAAARRDAAGGEPVVIAGLAQLGQRDARHGGGIGQRRAGDRTKQRGRRQRGDG